MADINKRGLKMKAGKIILIVVGVLIILGVFVAAMAGFVPGLSSLLGANKAKDLGVKYTIKDYQSAITKLGFSLDTSAGEGPDTKIQYSTATKKVDVELTNEEVSALLNFDHAEKFPVTDAQVKANPDGTVEGSAKVKIDNYKGFSFDNAVYGKGTATLTSPTSIKITNAESLVVGRMPTPVTDQMIQTAEDEANSKLASIPGLSIQSVSMTEDGKVHFVGIIPESAKRVPR